MEYTFALRRRHRVRNIYLYCAANGLATVCRGTIDRDALKKALKLPDTTVLHLNHPISYPAGSVGQK